jgi:hypothetical protein
MNKDAILDAAKRMLERGESREKVKAFVQRARSRMEANTKDTREASELSPALKVAQFGDRVAGSASFGIGPLVGDALAAGLDGDKSFKDVRAERADRNEQLGAVGYAGDVIGGLITGKAAYNALKLVPKLATASKAKPWLLAAGEAGTQGGVTGAAEGLDDLSLEGLAKSAREGAKTAAFGTVFGAGVGKAAGGAAKWWKGRNLAKELVAKGVNVEEAKLLARELPMMTMEKANAAIGRVDEMVKQGRGNLVMAADVMQDEGRNALRASMNISGDAETVAKQRLRERDAGIVRRGRKDLGDAAGYTPEQMDAHESAILGTRKAKADESFANAREQGSAFDAEHPFDPRKKPAAEAPDDPFSVGEVDPEAAVRPDAVPAHALTKEALADDIVKRKLGELAHDNPDEFKGVNPAEWRILHSVYTSINREIGALKKSGNAVGEYFNGLTNAQRKIRSSLAARSDEFLPANADFADYSRRLEAYETGQDVASQALPSDARRLAAGVDPTHEAELNKGFVDRMAEGLGRGPNEALGPAAAANNSIRNATVGTENAAEKIRDRLGDAPYQKLLGNAKAEGQMAATSHAGLGNSSTAKQQNGLAGMMNVLEEAGASISANPIWFGTQFARRVATDKMGSMRKKVAMGAAQKISDALTRGGEKEAKSVLEDLIAEMNRRQMADAAGKSAARRTRNAVARAAAPND